VLAVWWPVSRLQRQAEAARLDGPVIGAVGARDLEVLLERARLEMCAVVGCYSRPGELTRAQRQQELQQLARGP
jgi:hypothetical protein